MTASTRNLMALALALFVSSVGAFVVGPATRKPPQVARPLPAEPRVSELTDARHVTVPVADYQRIVSLNTVADHLLLELVEPERLVGVTTYTKDDHPLGWKFSDLPGVAKSKDLETVLNLRPDLVIASKFAAEEFMARLREAGIIVFDLGEMRGVDTTRANIDTLGVLLDQPERARMLRARFDRELQALDLAIPDEAMPKGIYLSAIGESLFGGTTGTSYADLLRYAGVHDLAADHGYREWPRYTPGQLLAMDPPLIITQGGGAATICGHSSLRALTACQPGGRVIEIPGQHHSDPGLGLVDAAAQVQALVHFNTGDPHDRYP